MNVLLVLLLLGAAFVLKEPVNFFGTVFVRICWLLLDP
jgi:hypothetical protein